MAHRLLLADDSVTIQRVIELTFADEDIEVMAVSDGAKAIERIRSEHPDIVLADVDMPERDGFQVATFVKGTPEFASIPVILLTGAFEPVDNERVRACGCEDVLAKPFEPHVLIARVKELLAAAGTAPKRVTSPVAAAAPAPAPPPPFLTPTPHPAAFQPAAAPSVDPGPAASVVAAVERAVVPANIVSAPASPKVAPAPAVSPVPAPEVAKGAPSGSRGTSLSLDDYFDQLDAAFSELSTRRQAPMPAASVPIQHSDPLPPPTPVLARTFSALLAEEQGGPPTAAPAAPLSPAEEKIVAEVLRRLLAGGMDKAIRDQIAEIVSKTAERLVREEIERLKNL